MTGTDIGALVAIIGLIALAGFLALAETSLTRMNRNKAATLEEQGRRGAGLLIGDEDLDHGLRPRARACS